MDFSATQFATTPLDAFRNEHRESYMHVVNGCCDALSTMWRELGFYPSEIKTELNTISASAVQVWHSAVASAEQQKELLQQEIRDVELEIGAIQSQLGEMAELSDESLKTGAISLKQRLDRTKKLKTQFLELKQCRISEFKDIMWKINAIRSQFDQPCEEEIDFESPNTKITNADLDFLKCELESFCGERTRRMMQLESLWKPMKAMCSELDEDPVSIVKTVHPSLEFIEQSFSGMTIDSSFDRLPKLSEATFLGMEEKLRSLTGERSNRENELLRMKETLLSLWDALQTASDDLDRSILTRLMQGPARLHHKTFDKVTEEIHRQETAKARILKDLVGKRVQEIQHICKSGHLPLPKDVQETIGQQEAVDDTSSRHYATTLAHMTRILTEVTALAEKRSAILTMIQDLETARSEVDWLVAYERDNDRYKGRDCNRKLQKAIKAGKLREKMPSLVEKLRTATLDWERSEHQPFIFDGMDYRRRVLDTLELNMQPPLKSARSGRQTPSGRQSTVSDLATPRQGTRGATKQRTISGSNAKSFCFTEGRSMIARPQTSVGHYSPKENDIGGYPFKNAQTAYSPLQERLDQLLGTKRATTSGTPDSHTTLKSKIPLMPTAKQSSHEAQQSEDTFLPHHNKESSASISSSDEEMLDEVPAAAADKFERSLTTPKLNLSLLNRDVPEVGNSCSSLMDPSQRRTTF